MVSPTPRSQRRREGPSRQSRVAWRECDNELGEYEISRTSEIGRGTLARAWLNRGVVAKTTTRRRETMAGKRGSSGGKARSAISGRYVKPSTAKRHPNTTVVEVGSSKGKGKAKGK